MVTVELKAVLEDKPTENPIKSAESRDLPWIVNGVPAIGQDSSGEYPRNAAELPAKWPMKSNIRCWNCTRYFGNIPIGLPYKKINEAFHVYGCFCSFSCAYTYNLRSGRTETWICESLLYQLYAAFGHCGKIAEAPPKELMKDYGGNITPEEYGKLLKNCREIKTDIFPPPLISISPNYLFLRVNLKDSPEKYRIYRNTPVRL